MIPRAEHRKYSSPVGSTAQTPVFTLDDVSSTEDQNVDSYRGSIETEIKHFHVESNVETETKMGYDIKPGSVTEWRGEDCSLASGSANMQEREDDVMNEMMVMQTGDRYATSRVKVNRTLSAASTLDGYRDRRNSRKEKTIEDHDAVSLSDETCEPEVAAILGAKKHSGSITSSIKSSNFSNCSNIYFGCSISTSSCDCCRRKRGSVSSSICVNSDQTALSYDTEQNELLSTERYSEDLYLQNVIVNTKLELDNVNMELFEETPAYRSAFQTLCQFGAVVITGNIGDGKTMTSYRLMKDMHKENTIIVHLRDPRRFEDLVNSKRDTVVFIDDFLGETHLDECLLKIWMKIFPLMERMTRDIFVKFILTTRKCILEEAWNSLKTRKLFQKERIVDMSTFDLSGVKQNILVRHLKLSSFFVLEEDVHRFSSEVYQERRRISRTEILEISKTETPIGFPLCCYLFTREKRWADEGEKFFQNPVLYLKSEIERLERENKQWFCVLAVVLLCGSKISYYDITRDNASERFRSALSRVSAACGIPLQRPMLATVSSYLASSGTFLRCTDDGGYMFSHRAIEEAVALTYCLQGLNDIIELCPFRFLLEMVVTNSKEQHSIIKSRERLENSNKIELSILDFDLLVNRFVDEITAGNVWEVAHHNAFFDLKFIDRFFEIIQESGKIKKILTARHIDLGGDLLFYAADNEVPRVKLLERILDFYSKNQPRRKNHAGYKLNCFSSSRGQNDYLQHALSSALHTACRLGRTEIVNILIRFNARETPNLLCTAMQSQNMEIVVSLLQKYKWPEDQKVLALQEACKQGNIELFDLMVTKVKVKKGETIFSKCLLESAKSGNVHLLNKILEKDCDVNYRGLFDRCALHEACIGGHESLVNRLLLAPNIDIYARDKDHCTALDYACKYKFINIVNVFKNAEDNNISL